MRGWMTILLAFALAGCTSEPSEPASNDLVVEDAPEAPDAVNETVEDEPPEATNETVDEDTDANETAEETQDDAEEGAEEAANAVPTAELGADATEVTAPATVTFTLEGGDDDGDTLSWTFDADGDGVADAEGEGLPAEASFEYTVEGDFTAMLNVTDGEAYAIAEAVISVLEDPMCYAEDFGDPTIVEIPGVGYVIDRSDGTWVYEESNGVPGPQYSSEPSAIGENDPLGGGCENGDTLVF